MNPPRMPSGDLIFISLPESIRRDIGSFTVDPAILLPVEVPRDAPAWNLENLSWEMILAGILRLLSRDPRHPHADYYRGFAFAVKPDIRKTLEASAAVKAGNKDFDTAEDFFRIVAGLDPEDQTAALNLALLFEQREEVYSTLQKHDLAEEYRKKTDAAYRELAERPDPVPDVHLRYGGFLVRHNDLAGGLASLLRYRESRISERERADIAEVIEALEKRMETDGLFRSGYELIRSGREKEGIRLVTDILEARPRDWNAWFLLGWGYRRIGAFGEAKKAFLTAQDLKPDDPDILNELAICSMELGESAEGVKALSRAAELDPHNIKILSKLAIVHFKLGHEAEARRIFTVLADRAPEDPVVRHYLEFFA
jgi:Flp pilus assembly protein TadD